MTEPTTTDNAAAAETPDRCSGIDDIRRLKEAYEPSGSRRASLDPHDSLFGMGVGPSPTVLAPPKTHPRRRGRTIGLLAAALVAASGTALGMAGLSRGGTPSPEPSERLADATGDSGPSGGATEGGPSTEQPAETRDEPEPEPEQPTAEPRPEDQDGSELPERASRPPRPVRPAERPPETSGEPEPSDPEPEGEQELGGLIDRALESAPAREEPKEPELPPTPSRTEVSSVLRDLSGAVRQCGGGESGIAQTRIVVEGATGRVRSVNVTGDFAGTETGSCIARTIREQAELPKFARERFEISFPYVL